MTKIFVMSRQEIESIKENKDYNIAIISITDPDQNKVNINSKISSMVCKTQFYDADKDLGKYYGITLKVANKIAKFASKHWNKVDYFIIHCESGISRSAGVAGAISKFFTGNDNEFFKSYYIPNMKCYRMVLDSLKNLK